MSNPRRSIHKIKEAWTDVIIAAWTNGKDLEELQSIGKIQRISIIAESKESTYHFETARASRFK